MAIVYLIAILIALCIYIVIIVLLFQLAIRILFPIGCVVFIGAVLFNYVKVMYDELIVGKGWTDSPAGAEPAFKQYFFRKAFYDYWEVLTKSGVRNLGLLEWVKDLGLKLFQWNGILWFTWPLALCYIAIVVAGTLAGVLAYLVFGLVHLTIVLATAALAVAAAYTLRGVELLVMLKRRISLKCPNGECHGDISLPYYICPNKMCGARHDNLLPGSYGVFKRQCKCGAWLPTLFLFGRNELTSYCPSCNHLLNSSMGVTRNIHIPIIGGRSSGKSHMLAAAMIEIHRRADDNRLSLAFPDAKYEKDYVEWKRYFDSGNTLMSTRLKSPDAFLVNLNSGGGDCLLYAYDPAGELFRQTDEMRTQEYFYYVNGIIFLIDPFSLPKVQHRLQKELSTKSEIRPSELAPQDAYANLLQILQLKKGLGSRSAKRLAVVLTKTDALGISDEIQQIAAHQPLPERGDGQAADSNAVRAWLDQNGEGNLLRGIESDFKNVSYFYCSPLGRLPDSSSAPFVPDRILNPFGWLLRGIVDFETGTPKPISQAKTSAALGYPVKVTPPGETIYGKAIAVMWAVSILLLLGGTIAFAAGAFSAKDEFSLTDTFMSGSVPSSPTRLPTKGTG